MSLLVEELSYFLFQPVLHDWCNKGCMCYPVSGMVHIKEPLLLIEKIAHVAAAGFLSHYLCGPLPYVRRHITVNKMCQVSLNKNISFLPLPVPLVQLPSLPDLLSQAEKDSVTSKARYFQSCVATWGNPCEAEAFQKGL